MGAPGRCGREVRSGRVRARPEGARAQVVRRGGGPRGGGGRGARCRGPRARWQRPGRAQAGAGQRLPANPVPAGCSFGGKVYALDETWHPDLGEPFGVMRCVLCACETVSAPNGAGRAPRGRAGRGAPGSGVSEGTRRWRGERASLQISGVLFRRRAGEEAPPSRLRCGPFGIAHYVPGCLPAPLIGPSRIDSQHSPPR